MIDSPCRLTNAFWRAQAFAWGGLALFGFCSRFVVFRDLTTAIVCTLVVDTLGFLLTSLMARQLVTLPLSRHDMTPRAVMCCAMWTIAIAALMAFVAYQLRVNISRDTIAAAPGNEYAIGFFYHLCIISGWTFAYLGIQAAAEARSQRLHALANQTRALKLELESLQLQIEPHFLFNALNTIVAEIGERPAVAEEMTQQLAAYLRYSLQRRDRNEGSVAEEIEAVGMYIRIQALRFDERFACVCTVDSQANSARIPHMAIQCLVENALKHGLQAGQADFKINVRVFKNGDELRVEVDNPSASKKLEAHEQTGTGLINLRRRCELRYPGRAQFLLSPLADRTCATLSLWGEPCSV